MNHFNNEERLPFERIKREIFIKKESETNWGYGQDPYKRPISELINYGVLNMNKQEGPSSHQFTDYIKRILNIDKAGHGGSLDPRVTGVLPVALGRATRITQNLLKAGKEYIGIMHLHKRLNDELVYKITNDFLGKIKQLPPVRSAVKRQLRTREIYYLNILEIQDKAVLFKIGCESGTYIRKLCLTGDTNIITNPKGCIKIRDLVDKEFKNSIYGSKKISGKHHTISWDNYKIIKSVISNIQKIPSPKNLYSVKTQSGIRLKLTPNHEVMIDTREGPKWKRISEVREGEYIYSPRKIELRTINPYLVDILNENILVADKKVIKLCIKALKNKFKTLYRGLKILNLLNCSFHRNKNGGIRIKVIKKICHNTDLRWNFIKKLIKTFKGRKGLIIKIRNPKINKNIAYMLGFLMSDGHLGKRTIRFFNKNETLINLLRKVHLKEFGVNLHKKIDNDGLIWLSSGNFVLGQVAYYLGIRSNKKESDLKSFVILPKNIISSFIKAYFDGDGSCFTGTENKNSRPSITIHTKYYHIAKILYILLKRLDIRSRLEKTDNELSGKGYNISMSTKSDKIKFINLIGCNHSEKIDKFDVVKKKLMGNWIDGDYDLASLKCSNLLKNLRNRYNIKRNICGEVYCRIEKGKIMPERGTIRKLVKKLKKYVSKKDKELNELERIYKSDFYLEKIINKKQISSKDKFVYDITVEKTHNFCPEGSLVVKNCHDIGKTLNTNAHMAALIRTKAGPFTDKTWHTLHDLKDAYYLYEKENNEEELRKIILPIEKAVEHLPKIWVLDSSVSSLCHGAYLSIPGISKYNNFYENETVAVMTLKNELICLGNTQVDSEFISKNDRGMAVKTTKVFMKRDLYSRII
ncbi:MAG: PUA domain-containing protein [Nanoarchaeota archaeon]